MLHTRRVPSNFAKVLIDGVPANDIGGAFDFADSRRQVSTGVEVFRGANSVLYGTDALTGRVSITTRRGADAHPSGDSLADGGPGTSRETGRWAAPSTASITSRVLPSGDRQPRAQHAIGTTVRHPARRNTRTSTTLNGTIATSIRPRQSERVRLFRRRRRLETGADDHLRIDCGGIADDSRAEHDSFQRCRSSIPLHEPVADGPSIRPLAICDYLATS